MLSIISQKIFDAFHLIFGKKKHHLSPPLCHLRKKKSSALPPRAQGLPSLFQPNSCLDFCLGHLPSGSIWASYRWALCFSFSARVFILQSSRRPGGPGPLSSTRTGPDGEGKAMGTAKAGKRGGGGDKGLLWRLPEVTSRELGKIGPAFGLGFGCGVGAGVGFFGGKSLLHFEFLLCFSFFFPAPCFRIALRS